MRKGKSHYIQYGWISWTKRGTQKIRFHLYIVLMGVLVTRRWHRHFQASGMFWFFIWVLYTGVFTLWNISCHAVFMIRVLFYMFYFNKTFTLKTFRCNPLKWFHYLTVLNCILEKIQMLRVIHRSMFRRTNITRLRWDLVYRKKRCYRAVKGRTLWKQLTG